MFPPLNKVCLLTFNLNKVCSDFFHLINKLYFYKSSKGFGLPFYRLLDAPPVFGKSCLKSLSMSYWVPFTLSKYQMNTNRFTMIISFRLDKQIRQNFKPFFLPGSFTTFLVAQCNSIFSKRFELSNFFSLYYWTTMNYSQDKWRRTGFVKFFTLQLGSLESSQSKFSFWSYEYNLYWLSIRPVWEDIN